MNDPIGLKMKDEEMFLEHFETYSNANLEAVLNVIKDDPVETQKYLLVFDDILGILPKNVMSKDHKFFSHFISTYRHGGGIAHEGQISLLFFTQYYKDLSPVLRANSSYYYFLGAHSEKHQNQYSEELNAVSEGNSELFLELYKKAKDENRYNFLTLDMRKLRAYKNLDTLIYERDDETTEPSNATNTDLVSKADDTEGS